MIWQADLHTHSTASDGEYTPAALVRLAQKAGITCLALTDHDTIDGVEEAIITGVDCGLHVLRGIELGAQENRYLHILGLGLTENSPEMNELCRKLRNGRDERKYRIADFLKEKDVPISVDEVEAFAGGKVVARPHFARLMVQHGYVSSVREAFDRYLDTEEYQQIERFKADAITCIQTIHAAGGKAVLAHPYQLSLTNERLEKLIRQLKGVGLDGLECWYPRHTPEMVQYYLSLAKKYELHISGGSDFHGATIQPDTILQPIKLELDWLW